MVHQVTVQKNFFRQLDPNVSTTSSSNKMLQPFTQDHKLGKWQYLTQCQAVHLLIRTFTTLAENKIRFNNDV